MQKLIIHLKNEFSKIKEIKKYIEEEQEGEEE